MLRALVWKDLRLIRLIVGLALAAIPAAFLFNLSVVALFAEAEFSSPTPYRMVELAVEGATGFALVVAFLAVIFTAGSLIAGERQERTADFLAALPPLRHQVLLSKAMVVGGVLLGSILLFMAMQQLNVVLHRGQVDLNGFATMPVLVVLQVLIGGGGIAWAGSSFCRTITPPVLMGVVIPMLLVPVGHLILVHERPDLTPQQFTMGILWLLFTMGLIGFVVGTLIYLRRSDG